MPASVLVIDDSMLVRTQLRRALSGVGFEVTESVDGEDAWQRLSGGFRPDVVICDINMPRMNGLELLERLSEAGLIPGLRVVVLTTEGQVEMVQRAKALGAKAWILKPFKAELIIAAAERLATAA